MTGNDRKLPEITGHYRHGRKHWKSPEKTETDRPIYSFKIDGDFLKDRENFLDIHTLQRQTKTV